MQLPVRQPAPAVAAAAEPPADAASSPAPTLAAAAATSSDLRLAAWEFAGLMLTYWCSARCAFCYVASGPHHNDAMDVDAAVRLWRALDAHAAAHGKTMRIHLAGGEPFGDWPRLLAIVRAARDAGLTRLEKVETNASWAVNDGLTRARLEQLDALGMEKLVVSCDVYHQQYVPFARVRRCVEAARAVLGRGRVVVRWWDFYNDPVDTRRMTDLERQAAFRAALQRHKDRVAGRAADELAPLLPLKPAAAFAGDDCVRAVLHSRHVHVDSYGHLFPGTCGGIILGRAAMRPGEDGPDVGEIWQQLAENWPSHPIVSAVVAGGSYELLRRARPLGYVERSEGYANKCHLCTHIRKWLAAHGLWRESVGPPECYDLPGGGR